MTRGSICIVGRSATAGILVLVALLGACSRPSQARLSDEALQRGLKAHVAGKLDEALVDYRTALKHDPLNKFAHYNIGLIDQSRRLLTEAENEYRLAVSRDPNYAPALFNLAILRTTAGDLAGAVDLYRRVIAISPNDAGAHLNLGLLLRRTGARHDGDAEIAKALQLDPNIYKPAQSASPSPSTSPQPVQSPK